MKTCFAAALCAAIASSAAAGTGHGPTHAVHGPADAYFFELAAPGTYRLPVIRAAADARLLDESGAEVSLHALFENRLTVLALMYTRCGDVCPMATARMIDLQALAAEDPEIGPRLSMISLSFDPAHDTPEVMADYGDAVRIDAPGAPEWTFLTAADAEGIRPVLEAYDQPVARKRDPDDPAGPFSHLLRVFLIDGEGRVRNIYSADFLDPRLVMNDLRTLHLDERAEDPR
jgi:cytochrome oxidase Cu insertion factor (SCO1/SenC/PrrC family)